MKYFVSIANTTYFRWQAELLIESFKKHGIEDDLIVGIANNPASGKDYARNLNEHKNKFPHIDYGAESNFPRINKISSLVIAIEEGMLGEEFCLLHPDMLLLRPFDSKKVDVPEIVYNVDDKPDDSNLLQIKDSMQISGSNHWLSKLGQGMIFRKVPLEFFKTVLAAAHGFVKAYGGDWHVERAAWLCAATQNAHIKFIQEDFEMSLIHPNNGNLIHYRHGIPSDFSKHFYKSGIVLANQVDPLDMLKTINPTPAANYMQQIIDLYRSK